MTLRISIILLIFISLYTYTNGAENSYHNILAEIKNPPQTNTARALRYAILLKKAGFSENNVKTQPVRNNSFNIYTELNCDNNKDIILIACHTDFAQGTTGIIDNWSGCVMSAALSSYFIDKNTEKGIIFAGFCFEEKRQLGSRFFYRNMSKSLRRRIKAVINLECLGLGRLNTWSNRSSDALESLLKKAALKNNSYIGTQVLYNFASDADTFLKNNIPAVTVHSLNGFNNDYINSTFDRPDLLNIKEFYKAFEILREYIILVDKRDAKITIKDAELTLKKADCNLASSIRVAGSQLVLSNLSRGSIEYKAGLRPGDVINSINGINIDNPREITSVNNSTSVGDIVEITVSRNEKLKKFELNY